MPWTINSEIYPSQVRSVAISITTSVNWISNLIVSLTFLSIIEATSKYFTFWLYGTVALLGFVFLYFKLPETKGLALEDIEVLFQDDSAPKGSSKYESVDSNEHSVY